MYESPSRNYIGDQHWRDDDAVRDGDEFQLEKPVLVQVGEMVGATETDLTELLDKRRKPQDIAADGRKESPRRYTPSNSITNDTATATARQPAEQLSQLRPKSLNALLGTPKGRIGRAAIPTKSPHELRREDENVDWDHGRPAKRQRVEHQSKIVPKPAISPTIRTLPPAPSGTRERLATLEIGSGQMHGQQSPIHQQSTRLESVSRLSPSSGRSRLASGKIGPSNNVPTRKPTDSLENDTTIRSPKRRKTTKEYNVRHKSSELLVVRHTDPPETSASAVNDSSCQEKSTVTPLQTELDEGIAPIPKPPKERVKLQMAASKPRKKLMYRDLLPQDQAPARSLSRGEADTDRKTKERRTSSRPLDRAKSDMTGFHEEEQHRLADRLNRYNGRSDFREDGLEHFDGNTLRSPRLFVSQEDVDSAPSRRHRTKNEVGEHHKPVLDEGSTKSSSRRPRPTSSSDSPQIVVPEPVSTIHETALTLSKMDEILFPRSRQSDSPRPPNPIEIAEITSSMDDYSPSSIPVTPPRIVLGPTPGKEPAPATLIPSSPDTQTQARASPSNFLADKSMSPKAQSAMSMLSEAMISNQASPKTSPSEDPVKAVHHAKLTPPKPPTSKAATPDNQLLPKALSPESSSPKTPTQKLVPPRPLPTNPPSPEPPSPKDRPLKPLSHKPTLATPYIPPPPTSPSTTLPEFDLRIAQKPLPAFQAPKAKPRPRSPLKKSTSDTTAMRPPPSLTTSRDKAEKGTVGGTNNGTATPWSKEAWDLFGCGRDGVQCSYEEFKRKEGLS